MTTSIRATNRHEEQQLRTSDEDSTRPSVLPGVIAVMFNGAIFGFFFAWICSTMWGLDAVDPRVAIEAMRAMNDSVQNPTFVPAFFFTPIALLGAALFARRHGRRQAWLLFSAAAAVYFLGGMVLTVMANVQLNEQLASGVVPQSREAAAVIWNDYSGPWQFWNTLRTVFSGISLALASFGLASMRSGS